jgi:hypothetical protein
MLALADGPSGPSGSGPQETQGPQGPYQPPEPIPFPGPAVEEPEKPGLLVRFWLWVFKTFGKIFGAR